MRDELLALFEAAGMEEKHIWEMIGTLPVTSPAASGVVRLILNGQFAPMFRIGSVAKDLRYAQQCGATYSLSLPITAAIKAQYDRAVASGLGDQNIGAISKLFVCG